MNRLLQAALACLSACSLAACAVAPDFQRPAVPAVTRYTAQPLSALPATGGVPAQRLIEGRDIASEWWQVFRSAPLDALMRQALTVNPDLQAADAALRVAQENVRAQQAAFFPTLSAQYEATRQGIAQPIASPLESGAARYTLHTAQLSVGYVPDVFGGNRRQVESLQAQAEAQRFQLEAAHLTLASNLVQAVVQRASTGAQIDATQRMVELAARQLALLRRQQTAGQIGSADVAAQEAALAQVQATLPPLQKLLAQQEHQLAALTGLLPGQLTDQLAGGTTLPTIELDALTLPDELPLSLPSRLVEQRPDIRVAEATLHAASAQIGVAAANRLPSFSLSAGFGSSAERLSQLFGAGTGFWGLGANVAQTVFDAGALKHRQRAAEAAYQQAEAQYRGAVLVAFQNVADTLQAVDADARALSTAFAAERAAERSLAIARHQQANGAVGLPAVLAAEQAWRLASMGRIQAQASRLTDTAALFQSLGGGWWHRSEAEGASASR